MLALCLAMFTTPLLKNVEVKKGYCYDTARATAEIIGDRNAELVFIKPRYRKSFPNGFLWHVVASSNRIIFDLGTKERVFLEDDYFSEVFGEPVLLRRVPVKEIEDNDMLWIATIFDEGPWEAK